LTVPDGGVKRVREGFAERFGRAPEVVARAPGRVNLIGEHTDYNGGFVLPVAIDRYCHVACGRRGDDEIRVVAADMDGELSRWSVAPEAAIPPDADRPWADYLRGVTDQLRKAGLPLRGLNAFVGSDVPVGAGLGSSAALCVAAATAFGRLHERDFSPRELAVLCRAAENEFVGCRCGIMDPWVSAAGRRGHALLIDCGEMTCTPVALPGDAAVTIIDSRVSHRHAGGEYNARRRQCEAAAEAMHVGSLREATMDRLLACRSRMDEAAFRRARHVLTENERTRAAAEALRRADYAGIGRLMAGSQASMRDDFQITTPEIDALVAIVDRVLDGRGGARMTGGGFGGSVVVLAPNALSEAVAAQVPARYFEQTGLAAELHRSIASDGAAVTDDERRARE
jgi:galactokinase